MLLKLSKMFSKSASPGGPIKAQVAGPVSGGSEPAGLAEPENFLTSVGDADDSRPVPHLENHWVVLLHSHRPSAPTGKIS